MNCYDPKKLSTFKSYLDMNNLYGCAMSEYLSYEVFELLKYVHEFDVMSISEKTPIGYFSKLTLNILMNYMNSTMIILQLQKNLQFQVICCRNTVRKIADKYDMKVGDIKKLIANLGSKTNYAVRYRNLQLYSSLGMKLTKIHRVLELQQSDWMKNYIDFNTEKRMNAANDFAKYFFKLVINSAYGKTLENLRKRINVRLINNAEKFLKCTSKPTHITHKIFDKDYAAIHEIKPVLIINKPNYVGFTVLDLSKWKMYDFHYNFIKKNFDAELLFTDTDSFTYEIKTENVYEKFF